MRAEERLLAFDVAVTAARGTEQSVQQMRIALDPTPLPTRLPATMRPLRVAAPEA